MIKNFFKETEKEAERSQSPKKVLSISGVKRTALKFWLASCPLVYDNIHLLSHCETLSELRFQAVPNHGGRDRRVADEGQVLAHLKRHVRHCEYSRTTSVGMSREGITCSMFAKQDFRNSDLDIILWTENFPFCVNFHYNEDSKLFWHCFPIKLFFTSVSH